MELGINSAMHEPHPFIIVILLLVPMWFASVALLGIVSGWRALVRKYPNRPEKALLQLDGQSGAMGVGIQLKRILSFSVCPSGLRVGVQRLPGVFLQGFFVPWNEIKLGKRRTLSSFLITFAFGNPTVGSIHISQQLFNDLVCGSLGQWPDLPELPKESILDILAYEFRFWIIWTCVTVTFLIIAPRLISYGGPQPSVLEGIVIPTITLGVICIARSIYKSIATRINRRTI